MTDFQLHERAAGQVLLLVAALRVLLGVLRDADSLGNNDCVHALEGLLRESVSMSSIWVVVKCRR